MHQSKHIRYKRLAQCLHQWNISCGCFNFCLLDSRGRHWGFHSLTAFILNPNPAYLRVQHTILLHKQDDIIVKSEWRECKRESKSMQQVDRETVQMVGPKKKKNRMGTLLTVANSLCLRDCVKLQRSDMVLRPRAENSSYLFWLATDHTSR